jgi:hypothetical protein
VYIAGRFGPASSVLQAFQQPSIVDWWLPSRKRVHKSQCKGFDTLLTLVALVGAERQSVQQEITPGRSAGRPHKGRGVAVVDGRFQRAGGTSSLSLCCYSVTPFGVWAELISAGFELCCLCFLLGIVRAL